MHKHALKELPIRTVVASDPHYAPPTSGGVGLRHAEQLILAEDKPSWNGGVGA